MAVNMRIGSPVEAVDELGRYCVGEIASLSEVTVEVTFLGFGEEHNRVFAVPLAKHTIRPVTKKVRIGQFEGLVQDFSNSIVNAMEQTPRNLSVLGPRPMKKWEDQ